MERHILVTGGCGFLGSNFINKHFILNPDSFIVNLDALYHPHGKEENINLFVSQSSRYIFIEGNCCDYDLVLHILKTYEIDFIIHFAAQSHVQNYLTDTGKYVRDNIVGTQTLLEAARKYGYLEKFIHVSTDEVSGDFLMSPYDYDKTEQCVYCPTNPYAASKASAELLVSSYYHTFKLPIIITRGNSVYGPNQNPLKLIPKFIKALKDGGKIVIHGDGSSVRGFLHVYDATSAIDLILEKGVVGEIYNIGCEPDDECSVIDIAKGLVLLIVSNNLSTEEDFSQYIEYDECLPTTMKDKRYFVSNYKLKKLGWKLEIPFIDGLLGLINE